VSGRPCAHGGRVHAGELALDGVPAVAVDERRVAGLAEVVVVGEHRPDRARRPALAAAGQVAVDVDRAADRARRQSALGVGHHAVVERGALRVDDAASRRMALYDDVLDPVAERDRADRLAALGTSLEPVADGLRLPGAVLVVAVTHQGGVDEPGRLERLRVLDGPERDACVARPEHDLDEMLGVLAVAAGEPITVLDDQGRAEPFGVRHRVGEPLAAVAVVGAPSLVAVLGHDFEPVLLGERPAVRQLCRDRAVAVLGRLRGVDDRRGHDQSSV
jgi:hypothetical protein